MTEVHTYRISTRGDATYLVSIPYVPGAHSLARDVPIVMELLAARLDCSVNMLDRFDQVEMIRSTSWVADGVEVSRVLPASSPG